MRRWFVFGFEGVCVPFAHVRVLAIAARRHCFGAAGVDEGPTRACVLAASAQRLCDSCADALRTKNPVCWQVLTFRGRQGERPVRRRAACFAFRLFIALVCRIVRSRAFVLLLSTTSNRQNLPAKAVFRARPPCFELQMPCRSFLLLLVNSEQVPPPRARVEAGASGDMPCRRLHAAHRCFCR